MGSNWRSSLWNEELSPYINLDEVIVADYRSGDTIHTIADHYDVPPKAVLLAITSLVDDAGFEEARDNQLKQTSAALADLRAGISHGRDAKPDYLFACEAFGYPRWMNFDNSDAANKLRVLSSLSWAYTTGLHLSLSPNFNELLGNVSSTELAALSAYFAPHEDPASATEILGIIASARHHSRVHGPTYISPEEYDRVRQAQSLSLGGLSRTCWPLPRHLIEPIVRRFTSPSTSEGPPEVQNLYHSQTVPISDSETAADYVRACLSIGAIPSDVNYEFWLISELAWGRIRPSAPELLQYNQDLDSILEIAMMPWHGHEA